MIEGRARRPQGASHTSNFHHWSQAGKRAPQAQRGGEQSYASPYQHYHNYPQQQPLYQPSHVQQLPYGQPQYPPPAQYYHQPQPVAVASVSAPVYGYNQARHHSEAPAGQLNSASAVSEVKSRILQARARNLALKRALVQSHLHASDRARDSERDKVVDGLVPSTPARTQSAQSSRDDAPAPNDGNTEHRLPDAIRDLEEQLSKLKSEAMQTSQSSQNHKVASGEGDESTNEDAQEVSSKRKEDRSRSRRTSKETGRKVCPDVPRLPLGGQRDGSAERVSADVSNEEQGAQEEAEEGAREQLDRIGKKKRKKRRQKQVDVEKQAKEDEALAESLDKMMRDVNTEIETNQGILGDEKRVVSSRVAGGLNAPLDSYRMKELRRNEDRKKRAEARDKIDSLLKNENLEFKIPRWKHELNGNMAPSPELVLKGRSLFRMAARIVLYFYAKPIVRVRVMRIMGREAQKEDLTKSILLALDTCASWLTSVTKVPLASIVQDQTLNFSGLQHREVTAKKGFHQQCNLQLKVRVTAMVRGITNIDVDCIPPHIKSFLQKLITDGNFFRSDFLYAFEKSSLDFDQLGASNDVTRLLPPEELLERAQARLSARGEPGKAASLPDADDNVVVGDNTYLVAKARMLITSFLFLRVFVTNVMLSPWDHGIGPKPGPKQKKVIDNLRMSASIFYAMLRLHQPNMPRVMQGNRRQTIQRMKSGRFGHQGGLLLGPDQPQHPASEQKNEKSGVIRKLKSLMSFSEEEEGDADKDTDKDKGDEGGTKCDATDEKTDGKKKLPAWLTSFADKVLGEAQALHTNEADDPTSFLLGSRPPFDNNLEHLHVFLFGDKQLEPAKSLIEPWMEDLAGQLAAWVDSLTRLIIKDMKIKYQHEHDV